MWIFTADQVGLSTHLESGRSFPPWKLQRWPALDVDLSGRQLLSAPDELDPTFVDTALAALRRVDRMDAGEQERLVPLVPSEAGP